MKCPDCKKELIELETDSKAVCPKCQRVYDDEELNDIRDVEMIEEDTKIWKSVQKFK